MSAQAFKIYNLAKKRLGLGSFNYATMNFRMQLHTSASNAATLTLGVIGSVTSEVTEANGYSSSGKPLTSRTWTVGASAKQYALGFGANPIWTGTGGTIPNIKFAVIWASGASANARYLVCNASLTSAQFTLSQNNTLTVQFAAAGAFTMQ
jgi:hypothetical protein